MFESVQGEEPVDVDGDPRAGVTSDSLDEGQKEQGNAETEERQPAEPVAGVTYGDADMLDLSQQTLVMGGEFAIQARGLSICPSVWTHGDSVHGLLVEQTPTTQTSDSVHFFTGRIIRSDWDFLSEDVLKCGQILNMPATGLHGVG